MNIGKFSYYSRIVHRLSLIPVVILGLIQMVTGLAMKYPQWFSFLDQTAVRLFHFQVAGYFSLVFAIQILTGLTMYCVPWVIRKMRKPLPPPLSN